MRSDYVIHSWCYRLELPRASTRTTALSRQIRDQRWHCLRPPLPPYQSLTIRYGNMILETSCAWLDAQLLRICCIVMNFDGDDGGSDGSPYSNIYFVNFKQHYLSTLSGYLNLGILQHLASGSQQVFFLLHCNDNCSCVLTLLIWRWEALEPCFKSCRYKPCCMLIGWISVTSRATVC